MQAPQIIATEHEDLESLGLLCPQLGNDFPGCFFQLQANLSEDPRIFGPNQFCMEEV
jgi:hypothetical protein